MYRTAVQQTRQATMRGYDASVAAVRTVDTGLSFLPGASLWIEGHKPNQVRGRT